MKQLYRSIAWGVVASALVFGAVFVYQYLQLAAHQPPHQPGLPMPPEVTGYPPSAAWIIAAPLAMLAFVGTFIVVFIAGKIRGA